MFRAWPLILVCLLLATALPVASQEPATDPWTQVVDDAAADERIRPSYNNNVLIPAGGQNPLVDLRAAWFQETPRDFGFRVQLQDLDGFDEDKEHQALVDLRFKVHDTEYQVRYLVSYRPDSGFRPSAELHRVYQDNAFGYVADWISQNTPTLDTATNIIETRFHRNYFQDSIGSPPYPGRNITGFWARSASTFQDNGGIDLALGIRPATPHYIDDAPGTDLVWDVRHGLRQQGPVRLVSEEPVRASNGEAATFVFFFKAFNDGTATQQVTFQATEVPNAWDITFPRGSATIPPRTNVSVPVILLVPFEHKHGSLETFVVETINKKDPASIGRVELGLLYTETPQPTGHHDKLWLHSDARHYDQPWSTWAQTVTNNDGVVFMNARDDDPLDDKAEIMADTVQGIGAANGGDISYSKWRICLSPRLLMGLDFDMDGTGTLEVPIKTPMPMAGTVLSGQLYHISSPSVAIECRSLNINADMKHHLLLSELGPSDPTDFNAGQTHTFKLPIVPTEEADFIRYNKPADMILELKLAHQRPIIPDFAADAPRIVPGGWMRLPLMEYQDPVDELLASFKEVRLLVNGTQQRLANPGAELLFQFTLQNTQGFDDTFDFNLWGSNKEWATLARGVTLDAPNGTNITVPVIVKVPASAIGGDRADLIIEAVSQKDPDVRALGRLLIVVDTGEKHFDDKGITKAVEKEGEKEIAQRQEQEKKDRGIPAPGLALLAAALVLAATARRRRA